jgi:hypothetical protein
LEELQSDVFGQVSSYAENEVAICYLKNADFCHTGESRYPVTFPNIITLKVAGFRVKPGMTEKKPHYFL